ncbi:MAG: 2Fe-2S iron-sulfur cluster-binding protein [Gammaproteobacteria bacterium]|nr:2Fe-2S iron-sulfur cluster-binding protein [Gammaproteobacteria bacterium]
MATITFIQHDGTSRDIPLTEGTSLMQLARDNRVPGIDGDCGGACACGTCHVIIDREWLAAVGPRNAEEKQMLELTPDVQPGSRLACQIQTTGALDGLRVHLPEHQM